MNKPQNSQNKPIEEKKVEKVEIIDKPVTNSELLEQWHRYADDIKDYKPRLSSLLYFSTPTISEETITYKVESSIQKNEMDRNREELLIFLRKNLSNNSLTLETIVEENSSTIEIQPYTASEKLAAMIDKNPALLELQRRLNLELR